MFRISAIIITFNEEKNIARCIDSLLPVADEILVVDSWSTDNTQLICEQKGVRFVQNAFKGYIEQKNFGAGLITHDYILSIDADEYLSPELSASIAGAKKNDGTYAFSMNRLSSYRGQWIHTTDWYPDKKVRLWHKEYGQWSGPNPHEQVMLNQPVAVRHLEGDLMHVAYKSAEELLSKANLYSSLFASSSKLKTASSKWKVFYKSIYTFIRNYMLRRGFMSGLAGLQISFSNAVYTFFKYSKLLELNRSLPVFSETPKNAKTPNGISVIIPNFNGTRLFPVTLPPLFKVMEEANLPFEVIVSDDCSTDHSIEFLKTHYPQIIIVPSDVNRGFSGTCNAGIKKASFDLVLLLNSDIILTSGYFTHQLKYFQQEDTFGVMGKILGWDNDKIQDAAKFPSYQGLKVKTSLNYMLAPMGQQSLYTFYLSGANALVSREKLIALGGFDELFSPFYIEDCDLSFRAWRLGWKCYYENRAICRHQTSSTVKAKSKKEYVETVYNRNKLYLHAIHLQGYQLLFWWVQVILELIFRSLVFRLTYVSSLRLFLSNRKHWMQSRKNLKALMKSRGESSSLARIAQGISESLYKKKFVKFYSSEAEDQIRL
jgi:GT2 family glycosyltransferase